MRWEDERWIKVYTRDTADWLALSWQAQGLLLLLLRKVDSAGTMDLGRKGKAGLAAHIGGPSAWRDLEPALDELLADGCVEMSGSMLVVPNFIEAQSATQSDVARKRRERERARDSARHGSEVTNRDDGSQNVTKSHEMSHDVTRGHALSRIEEKRGDETETENRREGGVGGHTPNAAAPDGATAPLKGQGEEKAAEGATKPEKAPRKRQPKVALPDQTPLPGTPARAVYEAITRDPVLRPLVGGPGDFASRVTAPGAYPGVDVLAEVQRAGEYAAANAGKYSDGRAFLRNWLQRKADDLARRPQAAKPIAVAQRPKPLPDQGPTPEEREEIKRMAAEMAAEKARRLSHG